MKPIEEESDLSAACCRRECRTPAPLTGRNAGSRDGPWSFARGSSGPTPGVKLVAVAPGATPGGGHHPKRERGPRLSPEHAPRQGLAGSPAADAADFRGDRPPRSAARSEDREPWTPAQDAMSNL